MKKYNHGFVLGKFMPLHSGHIFLLETAKKQCNKLTILLCAQPDDPIPGAIRLKWLKKHASWVTKVEGKWDLNTGIFCKTVYEYRDLINEFLIKKVYCDSKQYSGPSEKPLR